MIGTNSNHGCDPFEFIIHFLKNNSMSDRIISYHVWYLNQIQIKFLDTVIL